MALLREYSTDEYWAEYAVLVIRDLGGDSDDYEGAGLLAEQATGTQPGGTIAMAGAGWLWARATSMDGDNEVRLEAHDSVPADDPGGLADWDDVVETPYLSFSGTVALSLLTAGVDYQHALQLGPKGHYRVRVCCRRQPDTQDAGSEQDTAQSRAGDIWRLQFWPAPGGPEPPRWLARAPVVIDESPAWDGTLDPHLSSVLRSALDLAGRHPDGVSAAQITADRAAMESAYADHADPGSPLWPPAPRPFLTTGHPDLDSFEAQTHAEVVAEWAERQRETAELAARFGQPAPVTVGDVLPLLVGMGLLTSGQEGDDARYRAPDSPGSTPEQAGPPDARNEDEDEHPYQGNAEEAADLVAVALWARSGQVGTVADLAELLLMSVEDVRANLRYAAQEQLLRVAGDPDDGASPLTLTPLPRREEPAGEPRSLPMVVENLEVTTVIQDSSALQPFIIGDGSARRTARLVVASTLPRTGPPPLPMGAPPRAGIVTSSGNLMAWPDGSAEVLASGPGDAFRAVETPFGVVMLSLAESVLVRAGGQAEVIATDADYRAAVSSDGRYLAVSQTKFGRRPDFALHRIDLADGSRQTLRWPADVTVTGMYGDAVFFGAADAGGLRWTPGTDPEPLAWAPRTVDRLSGRMLVDGFDEDIDGWLVIGPGGDRHNVLATGAAELALGGRTMVYLRYSPPAVTLFDVATGGADPRVVWLPDGSDTGTHGWAWEDAGHLLFSRPFARDAARAARLDVRTGQVEGVPFPGAEDEQLSVFVESLADPPG
jgi:hypothetical protein